RVDAAQLAPVAAIVHAAAEHGHVVHVEPAHGDGRPRRFTREALHDEHGAQAFAHADTLQLRIERAQRLAVIQDVVDDEHRAARERSAWPHALRDAAAARFAAVARDVHVIELVRKAEAPAELERRVRAAVHDGYH